MIDQPTEHDALKKLEPLLGEWTIEAKSPDGEQRPDEGRPASRGTGVCRVYQMSIDDGEWKLWRVGQPFPQRFTASNANR